MRKLALVISLFFVRDGFTQSTVVPAHKYVLVIHGGAGTISRNLMTPQRERAYNTALATALSRGEAILKAGGSALDAVEASVRFLEDDSLFNAGKGAVFTNEGRNELDAAIMDGNKLAAGAVAGISTIRNPISAARAVMEHSDHVLLTGRGAEAFAASRHLEIVDPRYFFTTDRWQGLLKAKQEDSLAAITDTLKRTGSLRGNGSSRGNSSLRGNGSSRGNGSLNSNDSLSDKSSPLPADVLKQPGNRDYKYGTVGAVALDMQGNLAAATSTGGMTNKKWNRVGDTPVIGAGTYANNQSVAISCTGWGEYFIRLVMAKTISDMMLYGKMSLQQATEEMIMKQLPAMGGDGGLIAVDKEGNLATPFCTEGMYRGWITQGMPAVIRIYK